jgi:hypothetical protein
VQSRSETLFSGLRSALAQAVAFRSKKSNNLRENRKIKVKNLTSLIIVLCLLIVLGCKCQSDLFDKPTPSPSPSATASASPTPTSSPSPTESTSGESSRDNRNRRSLSSDDDSVLPTGTYTGRGKNVTYNQTGDFLLRIDSVDEDGNVEAYLEASNGLTGKATMTGTVTKSGKIELSGTLDDGKSAAINGTVSGRTISAGYAIVDSNMKTQSGNFVVSRR